jgi:hypothetical protein
MARKRTTIVLRKLAQRSSLELDSMIIELTGVSPTRANDARKTLHWSQRFAASGKNFAPKIRAS